MIWSGDGIDTTTARGGLNFKPDVVWWKNRAAAHQPMFWSQMTPSSGVTGHGPIYFNGTAGVGDWGLQGITGWNADGVDISGNWNITNSASGKYVIWAWKAGDKTVTDTTGTLKVQRSTNVDAGFSLITYNGGGDTASESIGHGLGKVPAMIISKATTEGGKWFVKHQSLADNWVMSIEATDVGQADATVFSAGGSPDSSVYYIGTHDNINGEVAQRYVVQVWAEIEGYSKFASYKGNGNADGPFIYLGFKPAWVMIKNTTNATNGWVQKDIVRSPFNPMKQTLYPEGASEVADEAQMDFLSNGIKIRDTDSEVNTSASIYIYAAFADMPFKYATAR